MIYLCRHGQTDYNRDARVQGHIDTALTPLGERQAAAMGDLLHRVIGHEREVPWRIVASPLRRARKTAEIIAAKLGRAVAFDDRLKEVTVGEWEGRLYADVAREHPDLAGDRNWFFKAPRAETYDDMTARIGAWLAEQDDEPRRKLIVVSHGVAGRFLRGLYAGLSREALLEQDVPQDAIYRLHGGKIERLDCAAVSES